MRPLKNMRQLGIFIIALVNLVGMVVYGLRAAGDISRLYTQLRQQGRLLEIQERNLSNMQNNKDLAAELARPKILPLDEVTAAITNLSVQMRSHGLSEAYIKLDRRDVLREGENLTAINRVTAESTGSKEAALAYLYELVNGEIYYVLDKAQITIGEGELVRLKVVCAVVGSGAKADTVPPEYTYPNPFGGEGNDQ